MQVADYTGDNPAGKIAVLALRQQAAVKEAVRTLNEIAMLQGTVAAEIASDGMAEIYRILGEVVEIDG